MTKIKNIKLKRRERDTQNAHINRQYSGFTVQKIKSLWDEECLNEPDYQRGETWKKDKQEDLIYTILKEEHVPPLLFIENDRLTQERNKKVYDVNDGQQRIKSIMHFLNNEINIPDNVTQDYAGLNIETLKKEFEHLYETFISYDVGAMILSNVPNEETARVIFLRQQQGLPLTDGEKIHADFGNARDFIVYDMHEKEVIENKLKGKDDRDQKINFCAKIFMNEIIGDLPNKICVSSQYDNIKEQIDIYKRKELETKTMEKIMNIFDFMKSLCDKKQIQLTQAEFLIIYCVLSYLYNDIEKNNFLENFGDFIIAFFKNVKESTLLGGVKLEIYQDYNKVRNNAGKEPLEIKMDIMLNEWENYNNN